MTRRDGFLMPDEVPAQLRQAFDFDSQFIGKTGRCAILRTCINCGSVDETPVWQVRASIKLDGLRGVCKKCWPKVRTQPGRKGAASANWKGGRYVTKAGYVMVLNPERTGEKDKYIQEHRLVMQNHLGRKLHKGETVHHKNGVKTDNRIENLQLFAAAHARGQKYEDMQTEDLLRIIGEIEEILRQRS